MLEILIFELARSAQAEYRASWEHRRTANVAEQRENRESPWSGRSDVTASCGGLCLRPLPDRCDREIGGARGARHGHGTCRVGV